MLQLEPQVRYITSSALRTTLSAATMSGIQRRAYSSWLGRARFMRIRALPQDQRDKILVHYARQTFASKPDPLNPEEQKTPESPKDNLEAMRKEVWERMDKMRQVRRDFILRWSKEDPYNLLFGWSNDMLRGSKRFQKEAEPTVEKMKSFVEQGIKSGLSHQEKLRNEIWLRKKGYFETYRKALRPTEPESTTTTPSQPQPSISTVTHTETYSADLEYDPITNRMVRKNEERFSHYGQDLDAATEIPVKQPRTKVANTLDPRPSNSKSPPVADIIAELRQTKTPSPGKPTFIEANKEPELPSVDRKKLNEIYNDLHSNSIKPFIGEIPRPTGKSSGESIAESVERENSRRASLEDMATRLKNMGSRIQDLAQNHSLNYAGPLDPVRPPKTAVIPSEPSKHAIEKAQKPNTSLRKSLENEIASEEVAETCDPGYVARVREGNARRRTEIERMQAEIADLDMALKDLRSGSLKFDLTKQRKELTSLVESLESQMEPLYPYRQWDAGRDNLQPQSVPKGDVFPLIFGEKSRPEPKQEKQPDPSELQLAAEIENHKQAMAKAEELRAVKEEKVAPIEEEDLRLTDAQLVEAIRDIYEQKYGSISKAVLPEPIETKAVEAEEAAPAQTFTSSLSFAPKEDPAPIGNIETTKLPPKSDTPNWNQSQANISDPYAEPLKRTGPRRLEPVFSGRSRQHRWDATGRFHRRRSRFRRVLRKLFVFSGMTVMGLYVGGVFTGLMMKDVEKKRDQITNE
jgi:hypothetical protein